MMKNLILQASTILRRYPRSFLVVCLVSFAIQLIPAARSALIYERQAIVSGEIWRLWTGHLCHFGWSHCLADTGLLLALGYIVGRGRPVLCWLFLFAQPLVISAGVFVVEPSMLRYAGLSGVDLGLLVFIACQGWRRSWSDWFWPAVLLVYVGEVVLETCSSAGTGGGMIRFDEPGVNVATSAHVIAAVFALSVFAIARNKLPVGSAGSGGNNAA
jgi:rhomboid family GlyGly-CTERM serine protease